MGNAQSQSKKEKTDMFFNQELVDSIDTLASKLIFEQSFQNLLKLQKPEYCKEISVLTHRLLKKKLTPINVNVVSSRIKYGNQDLYAITEDKFKELKDIKERNYLKNEMCLNVSKFYTRIFQAYSAIVNAINPVYVYKDITGEEKMKSVFDDISSENKKRSDIGLRSLCSRRIFYLKPKKMGEKQMTLKVDNCKMNVKGRDMPYLTREHVNRHHPKQESQDAEPVEVPTEEVKEEPVEEKKPAEAVPEEEEKPAEAVPEEAATAEEEKPAEAAAPAEAAPEEDKKTDDKPVEELQVGGEGTDEAETPEPEAEQVDDTENKEDASSEGQVKMTSDIIETMSLADEPGILSLENLYKDVMEIETEGANVKGKFVMSKKSENEYKKDLKDFYNAFVPEGNDFNSINKFSDIKLKDFTTSKVCNDKDDNNIKVNWGSSIVGDARKKEDSLFVEYGQHFKTMISHVKEREEELIGYLHDLFEFKLDNDVPIKIKGGLTEDKLNKEIMPKVMKTIKTMYIECEKDFQKGIGIYNQIYKKRNNM